MKLIKPSFEIIEQPPVVRKMSMGNLQFQNCLVDNMYKQIEIAGRTCYKSEDKITEDSAKKFTDRMIRAGHNSMLEHGTVYLSVPYADYKGDYLPRSMGNYEHNRYSKVNTIWIDDDTAIDYVTTNYRVLVENNWLFDLQFICEPTEYHERRVTVKFICDRVTGESFLRHRAIDEDHPLLEGEVTREMEDDINSFARESTRYCNYSNKTKFNGEFTIINPPEFYDTDVEQNMNKYGIVDDDVFVSLCSNIVSNELDDMQIFETWLFANLATQWSYNRLISLGWHAQQARRVIPMDIKSPLVMTAFVSDWKHFFDLRCDEAAHPQARELAIPLKEEFKNRQYI